MTASYVRLARVREVLNSVQALRGVPVGKGNLRDGAALALAGSWGRAQTFPVQNAKRLER